MTQIARLPGWPPVGGSGPEDPRSAMFAAYPEEIKVRAVDRVVYNRVDMTCKFGGEVVTFRFLAETPAIAEDVATVVKKNAGQDLRFIGMIDVWVP